MKEGKCDIFIAVAVYVVSCAIFCAIGIGVGLDEGREIFQKECVDRGFAEYNQKTGCWQWKSENGKQ